MRVIMFKNKNDVSELMEKAYKAKKHVCELIDELEDTVREMQEEYGNEENYRYDGRYSERMNREDYDSMNRRGGRYDYRRY